jgi:hypothetical protein
VGNSSFFIWGSIDVIDLNRLGKSGDGEFPSFDEILIDKGVACPAIYEASDFDGFLLLCPSGKDLHMDIHSFIVHFGYKYRGELETGRY